jgi:glutamate-ammonia-ligase adenylyltransferase
MPPSCRSHPACREAAHITALIDALLQGGAFAAASALRVARQLTLERLAVQDIEAGAAMVDVARTMTEAGRDHARPRPRRGAGQSRTRFSIPVNGRARRIDFWVVGMGKLGGRRLNVVGHRPRLSL